MPNHLTCLLSHLGLGAHGTPPPGVDLHDSPASGVAAQGDDGTLLRIISCSHINRVCSARERARRSRRSQLQNIVRIGWDRNNAAIQQHTLWKDCDDRQSQCPGAFLLRRFALKLNSGTVRALVRALIYDSEGRGDCDQRRHSASRSYYLIQGRHQRSIVSTTCNTSRPYLCHRDGTSLSQSCHGLQVRV